MHKVLFEKGNFTFCQDFAVSGGNSFEKNRWFNQYSWNSELDTAWLS